MSPDGLSDSTESNQLIHVSVNSLLFGFIDDFYMMVSPFTFIKEGKLELKMQSQLRIGSGDFLQNYNHIKSVLDCLNKEYDNKGGLPRPCSLD